MSALTAHGERYAEVADRAERIATLARRGADYGAVAAACQRLAAVASYALAESERAGK